MDRSDAITIFRSDVRRWRKKSVAFAGLHIVLGLAALAASGLVAAKPAFMGTDSAVLSNLAWAASFATSVLTFFSAQQRAARYRTAATMLETQIILYDADTTYTLKHVVDAKTSALRQIDSR